MRTHVTIPSAIALALVLAACGETFEPASHVDKLRVLAVRAEHPELVPLARGEDGEPLDPQPGPQETALETLVADPRQLDDEAREVTVLHVSCTPDPVAPGAGICTALDYLSSPAQLAEVLGQGGACEGDGAPAPRAGFVFAGVERCDHELGCGPATVGSGAAAIELPAPVYRLPEGYRLDELPAGNPRRVLGVQATVLAIAVQASAEELVEGAELSDPCAMGERLAGNLARLLETRESVTALKRLQIKGPDDASDLNVNPALPGITARGVELPAALTEPVPGEALVRAGESVELLPLLPRGEGGEELPADQLFQRYTRYGAEGNVVAEEQERWLYSWYATAGSLEELRTRSHTTEQEWIAPDGGEDDPVPASRRVFLYAVVRDVRGGIDWVRREVRIE